MKKKMRRYSIYLPKELNARLDAYLREHPGETASGYCRKALEEFFQYKHDTRILKTTQPNSESSG
jgi:predicted DNA-binding protein